MGELKGFKKYTRVEPAQEAVEQRLQHFREFYQPVDPNLRKEQAARCMDCGVPFCHSGCPLGNLIPDFNDAVYKEDWQKAYQLLAATNNFPEFTGRICPAPCEGSCVLGINNHPVAIEFIEKSIIERAFAEGWVSPALPNEQSGKRVAVIGSGPAGLACADELNKAGHSVTVFEKSDRIGGLLRYGIPDFKLEKKIIDRRLSILEAAGIQFQPNTAIGSDISAAALLAQYDAVVLCIGATVPRDLPIPGCKLKGIHFAMEFLEQNNRRIAGEAIPKDHEIDVKNHNVLVIGGGDTGSDCIGTSNRLGAKSVLQIELLSKPPVGRTENNPWPQWPFILRTSSSHEEGCERDWEVYTKAFLSEDGEHLSGVQVVDVRWEKGPDGRFKMQEQPDTLRTIPAEKAFLAIGFLHPAEQILLDFGLERDDRGLIQASHYRTSHPKVFTAGDARRGPSLVVWAIQEGREAANAVDRMLRAGEPGTTHTLQSARSVLAL